MIQIHFFHCFTCIGKQPVQDSRKGWMELEKLHEAPKTGTEKRKKWGRIQLKEIMADWFPPGNMFLSTSILCQLGPTLSCRQSCEMSISCKDKRKITNSFCALIVYNFYYKKNHPNTCDQDLRFGQILILLFRLIRTLDPRIFRDFRILLDPYSVFLLLPLDLDPRLNSNPWLASDPSLNPDPHILHCS